MDPIRHVDREEPVDLAARVDELRNTISTQMVRQGDTLVLAGALQVGARGLTVVGTDETPVLKRRLVDLGARLRDSNEALEAMLGDERLAALSQPADESPSLGARIKQIRELTENVDRALEALAFLEETPAMEVDFGRLHRVLTELVTSVEGAKAAPLVASHVTEVEFRL